MIKVNQKIPANLTIVCFALLAWFGGDRIIYASQSQISYPDLNGEWICTSYCPAGGEGRLARIDQKGEKLTFINEGGGRSDGKFAPKGGQNHLVAPDWGDLKGTFSTSNNEIHWANGTIWLKK